MLKKVFIGVSRIKSICEDFGGGTKIMWTVIYIAPNRERAESV